MCRPWFKAVEATPKQNIITEAYLFANMPVLGISSCAPILTIRGKDRLGQQLENSLFAVTCNDIRTIGRLDDFFKVDTSKAEQGTNFYVIFNPHTESIWIQRGKGLFDDEVAEDSSFPESILTHQEYLVWRDNLVDEESGKSAASINSLSLR